MTHSSACIQWIALMVALAAAAGRPARAEDTINRSDYEKAIAQMLEIGSALDGYHKAHGHLPAPAISRADGTPLLSWRVAILPLLGHGALYKQFHLDEPWDSPHNMSLAVQMPPVFRCPASKLNDSYFFYTVYQAPRCVDSVFEGPGGTATAEIKDDPGNTIALVEVDDDHAVIWTKPDDWQVNLREPMRGLGGHFMGRILVGNCDASVCIMPDTVDRDTMRFLLSRAGGEDCEVPEVPEERK